MTAELNVKSINSHLLPGLLPTASQLLPSSLLSSPAGDKQEQKHKSEFYPSQQLLQNLTAEIMAKCPTGSQRTRTDLWWFELRGFAVKHIHRFDAILQHADRPVEHSHQVAENEEQAGDHNGFGAWIPSVELQSPGCQTLLSLPPHSAEGSHPGVQQSGTGTCTWRHQWQFSSLQDVQKKKKEAKWRNVTQHVMFKTILRNLREALCIHCYIHITDKLKKDS